MRTLALLRTRQDAGVVAVDDIINAVLRQQLVQELGRQVVRHICSTGVCMGSATWACGLAKHLLPAHLMARVPATLL